jgi:hypothetical protein
VQFIDLGVPFADGATIDKQDPPGKREDLACARGGADAQEPA